eukprot:gnl/Hemi2/2987_TR1053_c0_g1_i1.p1 gnl/Hemi2/2987_TR1053_c0_g1~~gnl/Hemi2/2987_TR1053_c0_g1_i1.p1  ORF type:complete len:546 (+),score=193.92 gnl/Hemi2/2987_TR1053_c0_g1_i1:107-1744(+)
MAENASETSPTKAEATATEHTSNAADGAAKSKKNRPARPPIDVDKLPSDPNKVKRTKKPLEEDQQKEIDALRAKQTEHNEAAKKLIKQMRSNASAATFREKKIEKVTKELEEEKKNLISLKEEEEKENRNVQARLEAAARQRADFERFKKANPHSDVATIDNEIRKLEQQMRFVASDLKGEKELMAQIKILKASKANLGKFDTYNAAGKEVKDAISRARDIQKEKHNAWYKQTQRIKRKEEDLAKLQAPVQVTPESVAADKVLQDQADKHKAAGDALQVQIKDLKKSFRDKLDAHYQAEREFQAAKRAKSKREWEQRQADRAARIAQEEKDLAAIVPWQEEMDQCDILVRYLQNLMPSAAAPPPSSSESATASTTSSSAPVSDGAVLLKRDADLPDWAFGAGKKQKQKRAQQQAAKPDHFKHSMETLRQFSKFGVTEIPVNAGMLATAIAQVQAKKEYYKTLPRDAEVPKSDKPAKQHNNANNHNNSRPAAFPGNSATDFPSMKSSKDNSTTTTAAPSAPKTTWGPSSHIAAAAAAPSPAPVSSS